MTESPTLHEIRALRCWVAGAIAMFIVAIGIIGALVGLAFLELGTRAGLYLTLLGLIWFALGSIDILALYGNGYAQTILERFNGDDPAIWEHEWYARDTPFNTIATENMVIDE